MFNKEDRKKYLRFTDSAENNNNCVENELGRRNIDLIINKLERKVNTGNINSGNADVILKISSQNQETTRTSKNNDSLVNNLSNLLANNNIVEKDNELSQELANNANQQNPNKKEKKISAKAMVDVDIDLNNNLKDELEVQETNKFNLILSTSNSHANMNSKNIILSRNKLENKTDNSINNSNNNNISTLSTHFDNSRYFLNKKASRLIPAKKIDKKSIQKSENEKDKGNNMSLKFSINNSKKDMKKNLVTEEQKKDINLLNKNNKYNVIIKCIKKINYRNRYRSCNIMNVLRNIFIGLIIITALAFYATIFIIG
jgi:hypothetical protein